MTSPLLLEHFDELISTPEDVEKLNHSILQLAVTGNLVSQDIADGSTRDAFSKFLKLNHGFIGTNEKPYDLPENWEWAKLISISDKVQDGTHFSPKVQYAKREKNTYLYITSKNIKEDGVNLSNVSYIDEDVHRSIYQRCNPEKGDVLLVKDGAMTGMVTINNLDEEFTLLSSVALIKTNKNVLLPEYLRIFLRSPIGFEMITGSMSGSAIRRIVMNRLEKTLIAVPPIPEQQRIVARVEELFAQTRRLAEELSHSRTELDRLNESALARLLASEMQEEFNERWNFIAEHFDLLTSAPEHIAPLRQSILELAVRGKLTRREAGDESAKELLKRIKEEKAKLIEEGKLRNEKPLPPIKDSDTPFELPKGWEWARMNDLCTLITDGTHYTPQYLYDGVPFLSVKDMSSGYLDFSNTKYISQEEHEKLTARCKPEFGDVLLTKVGTTGIAIVVDTDKEFSIFVSVALLKFFQDKISPDYLALLINSPLVKRQSEKYTMGVGNKNLVLKHIRNFFTPIPPFAEQERIVKRVEQLLDWCDALEARLKSAEDVRGRLVESVLSTVGAAVYHCYFTV